MKYILPGLITVALSAVIMSNAFNEIKQKAEIKQLKEQVDYLSDVVVQQSEAMAALAERQTELERKLLVVRAERDGRLYGRSSDDFFYKEQNYTFEDYVKSRGVKPVTFEVTAYDLSYASCKKYKGHPEYGITASGKHVTQWQTIAMGKAYPFGTRVFIPFFADKPNEGVFVCEDRGGAIKDDCIDVYMPDNAECMQFGRQMLECYVLD